MKRIVFMLLAVTAIFFSAFDRACEAKDVWVERWEQNQADVYVMDTTLEWEENLDGKVFRVSTKMMQDGKIRNIVKWKFAKFRDEMWRYETNMMGGSNMTVVSPGNKVFEFCMKRIGWTYRTEDFWCY